MKKFILKVSAVSIATVLFGSVAMAWDHDIGTSPATPNSGDQGADGKNWATIHGSSVPTNPPFGYANAECGIGISQSPIAINLLNVPETTNPVTLAADTNSPVAVEKAQDRLKAQYPVVTSAAFPLSTNTSAPYILDGGPGQLQAGTPYQNDPAEASAFTFWNDGHDVKIPFSAAYPGKLLVGRDTYPLVQFHFHTPSEHWIVPADGSKPYQPNGEVHFVHQRADGKIAVLAVLIEAGASYPVNNTLQTILNNVPATGPNFTANATAGSIVGIKLDPKALIPDESEYYTYQGSLTTPPCTDGVIWYVLKKPLQVSSIQLAAVNAISPNSNRIVQNTGTRIVEQHKDGVDVGR